MGVVIGDMIFDVVQVDYGLDVVLFVQLLWNVVMGVGFSVWFVLWSCLIELFSDLVNCFVVELYLVLMVSVIMLMFFMVVEYIDFYVGKNYVFNVGMMFCGFENVLLLNWLLILIGYNGCVLLVVVLGIDVICLWGQFKCLDEELLCFGVLQWFDLELEFGVIVGILLVGMVLVEEVDDMIFGYVLLNDWFVCDI